MYHRAITERLIKLSQKFPVVTVTGPRQSGKTTLVREVFSKNRKLTWKT